MTSVLSETLRSISDNYADVIEGGNSYAGGTSYKGIAGTLSRDELDNQTITATGGTLGTVISTSLSDELAARLVRTSSPPFFLRCTSQASGTLNKGAARKITAYTAGTDTYTLGANFTTAVASGDTFVTAQGFRRVPDIKDIDTEDDDAAHRDRSFSIRILPGKRIPWLGSGTQTKETIMEVRFRFMKFGRHITEREIYLENVDMVRTILPLGEHRGSYTQRLSITDTEPEFTEDKHKIVIVDRYNLLYRHNSTFL